MTKICCFVPAKKTSRRLPNKNRLRLGGKALFVHAIDVAKTSNLIEDVFFSSDCSDMLVAAEEAGAISLPRDETLSDTYTTNFQVLHHHYQQLKNDGALYDILILLQPTSPFRKAEALDEMIRYFINQPELSSLITVRSIGRPVGVMDGKIWRKQTPKNKSSDNLRFSEFSGHVVMFRPTAEFFAKPLSGDGVGAYELPSEWPDIDIDSPSDFSKAQEFLEMNPHFYAD